MNAAAASHLSKEDRVPLVDGSLQHHVGGHGNVEVARSVKIEEQCEGFTQGLLVVWVPLVPHPEGGRRQARPVPLKWSLLKEEEEDWLLASRDFMTFRALLTNQGE
jgi:hypothetical protein